MSMLGAGFQKQVVITEHAMHLQSEIDELRAQLAETDKQGKIAQYIDQLKQRDERMMERSQKIEDVSRQCDLQKQQKEKLEEKLQAVTNESMLQKVRGVSVTGYAQGSAGDKIRTLNDQNEQLLAQIDSLNQVNSKMLARITAMGGKGLSPAQLNEIGQDVKESQQRMLDGHKDQQETVKRAQEKLQEELQKTEASDAVPGTADSDA